VRSEKELERFFELASGLIISSFSFILKINKAACREFLDFLSIKKKLVIQINGTEILFRNVI